MQFRLIVALCVVGYLYAVQAKPPLHLIGSADNYENDVDGVNDYFHTTYKLLDRAYTKTLSLIDTLSVDETYAFHEWFIKFGCAVEKEYQPQYFHDDSVYYIEDICDGLKTLSLEDLIKSVWNTHIHNANAQDLSEVAIARIQKYLNDPIPDIMHYIEHEWSNFDGKNQVEEEEEHVFTEESSFNEILKEVVRKIYILRDSVWSTKRIEVNRLIIKLIKRADEELVKYGQGMKVEALVKSRPYKSLETLPTPGVIRSFNVRVEALLEGAWNNRLDTFKTSLIEFLKIIDKQIVKYTSVYNRIE